MHDDITSRRLRYLTDDEIDQLNDIGHEIGCDCPECRPDMASEPASGSEEAA